MRSPPQKKMNVIIMNKGASTGREYLNKYPKNPGMFIPASSDMERTMKLGAFPIYVNAPKNTEPADIASR